MVLGTLKQAILANVWHRMKVLCTVATTLVVQILLHNLVTITIEIIQFLQKYFNSTHWTCKTHGNTLY
jgi:hypothetical protein